MAKLEKVDRDIRTNIKRTYEIDEHIGFIKGVIEVLIQLSHNSLLHEIGKDETMGKVFLDVKDRLERIEQLSDEIWKDFRKVKGLPGAMN